MEKLDGIHHISSITADATKNLLFYEGNIVSIEPADAPEERLGLLMTGGGAPKG